MVSRLEDLAPPVVSRSKRLEVVPPLSEKATRAIAQDEVARVRTGLLEEARKVAREEAVASVDDFSLRESGPSLSWSMVALALLASAALAMSSSLSGLTGVMVVAMALVVLSILYAVRR